MNQVILITLQHYHYTLTKMNEKFKSRQQLADELGISTKTLSRKLSLLNICLPPGLISPKLYKDIIDQLRG